MELRTLFITSLASRFALLSARSEFVVMTTQNLLSNAWNTISKLHDSVITKRVYAQHLQQEMKLFTILNEQMTYLENWVAIERQHCTDLSGAFEALKASTLRLPVTGGARADIRAVNGAICSAVDVMQAMGSSVCYLHSKADGTRTQISELADVVAEEKAMLDECRELLASVGAMQVQESSLRTHLIQLNHLSIADPQTTRYQCSWRLIHD